MFLQYGRNYSRLNHREACQLKMTVNLYQREACRQDGRNYCHSLKTARYFAMCHWILINWTSQLKNCLSGKRFHASCMQADVSPKTARLWFLTSGGSLPWRRTVSCNICTHVLGLKRLLWEMQLYNFSVCIHPHLWTVRKHVHQIPCTFPFLTTVTYIFKFRIRKLLE